MARTTGLKAAQESARGPSLRISGLIAALALTALPAAATGEVPTRFREAQFKDWAVACGGFGIDEAGSGAGHACRLAQTAAAADDTWLASLALYPLDEGRALAELLVPPGVHLASGAFVGVDGGAPAQAVWERCTAAACRAALLLEPTDVAAWKRGRALDVRIRPGLGAPVVSFQMSLMGLTAGLGALEAPL